MSDEQVEATPPVEKKKGKLRQWWDKHHAKLWWMHSVYALALGALVATFAQRGFGYARFLVLMVMATWILVFLVFRFFGAGRERQEKLDSKGKKIRFYVMTYFLKNLYQAMLFFLLPFYWKSATWGEANGVFLIVLCVCAFLSTMDIIFDEVLMRWRIVSSVYYGFALFCALNLAIPALLPMAEVYHTMLAASGTTIVAFWAFHISLKELKEPLMALLFVTTVGGGVGLGYWGRTAIPPVPLYLDRGAVGPEVLKDGRLALRVTEAHVDRVKELHAVTDVALPGGGGQALVHHWFHEGKPIKSKKMAVESLRLKKRIIRLRSTIEGQVLPEDTSGKWHVDVRTDAGQLVGRIGFTVFK